MNHADFLEMACAEGLRGMNANEGGPFGAVVVLNGEVVGRGHNRVTSTNDPTAHAEVEAIRMACKKLGQFHLPGAVLYSSCEPCPMCLAAAYWANISAVYYAATRDEAAAIGFNDKFIYDEIPLHPEDRSIRFVNLKSESAAKLFEAWRLKEDRRAY